MPVSRRRTISVEMMAKLHELEYKSSVPSGTGLSAPSLGLFVNQYGVFNFCLFFLFVLSLGKLYSSTLVLLKSMRSLSFLAKYCILVEITKQTE